MSIYSPPSSSSSSSSSVLSESASTQTLSNNNFDLDAYKKQLNKIKAQKRLTAKEIKTIHQENKTLCIIRIFNKDIYNNINTKLTKTLNIKNLNKIISNDNKDNIDGKIIKKHNITIWEDDINISCVNILLNYELVKKLVNEKNVTPPPHHGLNNHILSHIMNVENISVYVDNSLTENIQELAYILSYISYHFNYYHYYDSIKFKSKNIENLRYALDCIKTYFNGDSTGNYEDIIKSIKEKQQSIQNLKKYLGGTTVNHILKKENIKNISNNNMKNTTNFLKKNLKECYGDGDGGDNIAYFKNLIEILKSLCTFDDASSGFLPPRFVYLQNLEKISIARCDDKILLRFTGDSDRSERDIPFTFFEKADKNFVAAVFEDLFGNNIKKKRCSTNNHLTVILSKKDFKKDKEIVVKMYDCIKHMLSKTHDINNVNVEESTDNDTVVYYKFISKENIANTIKRKLEKEDEEEDKEEQEEKEEEEEGEEAEKSRKKKSTKKNRNNK